MSTEVLPVGITCNLKCTYCYEQPLRDENPVNRYKRDAVLKSIEKVTEAYTLFGGESLILPIEQVEELLRISFERFGSSGIQTNGVLITNAHIELFKKYKTGVGISLDGPDDLNDSRWAGTVDATRKQTARTLWAIQRMCELHITPSLIITLHAGNCAPEKFPRLKEWFRQLDALGISTVNLHPMELDAKADTLYMPQDELAERMIDLWNLQDEFKKLRFTKFQEILKLLQGQDDVACTWHACDPHATAAVQSILNDGTPGLCARVFKDGQKWLPAEGSGHAATQIGFPTKRYHERQLALYVTPQEVGGCKDCEFFLTCMGNCPGEGEHGDWRMRSHYCLTYKKLFTEGAKRLRAVGIKPICDWEHRKDLETKFIELWTKEQSPHLGPIVQEYKEMTAKGMIPVPGGYHGDHTDTH
jgi:uncharacterized protein